MSKKRIWYVHCKTTEVYSFVTTNCQGFDADTDLYSEAPVKILNENGEYTSHSRDLVEINWDMHEKLKKSRFLPSEDYEIYIQYSRGGEIKLLMNMYKFKSLEKAFPHLVRAISLIKDKE